METNMSQCNSVNLEETKWKRNLAMIFWTRKLWKIRTFESAHTISNVRKCIFHSVGTTSDFDRKFAKKKNMIDKNLKNNIIQIMI